MLDVDDLLIQALHRAGLNVVVEAVYRKDVDQPHFAIQAYRGRKTTLTRMSGWSRLSIPAAWGDLLARHRDDLKELGIDLEDL